MRLGLRGPAEFGGNSEGDTPLPIPNRAVKPLSADGTWWETAWESRSPPVFLQPPGVPGGFFRACSAPARRPGQEVLQFLRKIVAVHIREGREQLLELVPQILGQTFEILVRKAFQPVG